MNILKYIESEMKVCSNETFYSLQRIQAEILGVDYKELYVENYR